MSDAPNGDARRIRVIPLGGVTEVGKNCTIFEYGDQMFMIDAGVKFPEEEMLGVDLVIADISYVIENVDRLRAVILTHGHEDHIGALPFYLRQLNVQVPVYGSALTLGMVELKLNEHRVSELAELIPVEPRQALDFGEVQFEFVRTSHSIPSSLGVAFRTPAGLLFHTSDFKFDETPVDLGITDFEHLRALANEGVLVLLSDCVRVEQPGHTPSEQVVIEALERVVREARGRVIISTFASNITRLVQAVKIGARMGRKTALAGRSLEGNFRVAANLGLLQVPEGAIVDLAQTSNMPDNEVIILVTGSQGEPTSVLSRIANGDHPQIKVRESDTVVISATPVPGNEETVSRTIDNLFRRGADVIWPAVVRDIHVSGHASQEDLKRMVRLLQPRYVVPMHGEYRMMVMYRRLVESMGFSRDRVALPELGDVWEFGPEGMERTSTVTNGAVLVDGLTLGDVREVVLRDRRRLAADGILIASIGLRQETGELVSGPELISRGFMEPGDVSGFLEGATQRLKRALEAMPTGRVQYGPMNEKVREVLGQYIYQHTRRRPMILSIITLV